MKKCILIASFVLVLFSCKKEEQKGVALLDANDFTTLIDEKNVSLYTLESESGIYMQVTNLGGRVVTLWTPDRKGNYEDIVLGYENIDKYINNEGQALHGELNDLDQVVWDVDKICKDEIKFSYLSLEMTYALTPDNELKIVYKATTDKPTVISLPHHGLFNLKGKGTITDYITPITEVPIFTDEIKHATTLYEPTNGRVMEVWSNFPSTRLNPGEIYAQTCIYKFSTK